MSYTALYRKFRPKSFDEVKGQDAVVTTLKNQIKTGRIGHAYLFCGTRGTGKTSIAKIMARAVNCENQTDGNPCNHCATCQAILKESSINVVEMDAASNNGVDDIRQIKEMVQYPPTFGKYRVFIIDEVHMLSNQAFNALLKTLEEPPEYVIFILATTEVHKIPITVLSRCQRYDFKRINANTISARLKELCLAENIEIEEKALQYIAKISDGAMRDALSLLDECVAFHLSGSISYDNVLEILGTSDNEDFEKLLKAINKQDILTCLALIESLVTSGRELSQFINDFLWYLRNLLIIKSSDNFYDIIDASRESIANMEEISVEVSKESLNRFIRILSDLYNKLRYSMQKRVLLELAIIKLMTPAIEESKEAILDRVSRVERAIAEGSVVSPVPSGEKTTVNIEKIAEENLVREVFLNKADYDDLLLLKKNWSKIIAGIGAGTKALLKGTDIEAFDGSAITIIFPNESTYNLCSKQEKLDEIKAYVELQYQKKFEFKTQLRDSRNKEQINYITREFLENNIKMGIDIES